MYTTAHIAEALGVTLRGVQKRAKKEKWTCSRQGRTRLFTLSNLPKDVRDAVLVWELRSAAPVTAQPQALAVSQPVDTALLTTTQRSIMCARLAFVRETERLTALGQPRGEVMASLSQMVREGSLPPHLDAVVDMANDRAGGQRGISVRSLERWAAAFARHGEAALAPAKPGRDLSVPAWAKEFLTVYQRPTKPSLADAYRQVFGLPHAPQPGAPSIWAVRRFVKKLSLPALEQGRTTGNARLSLLPHRRRDTTSMWPTDCFTMDGTTFDAEIQHPHTGQPWKPEITLVLDVATRRCVGVSVALAESAIATLDAVRMACLFGGIPAILYADNGPGYQNSIWTAEGTGLMARLGIELRHSIPGRPQGKGLMERAIQTICVSSAKRLVSCMHKDVDQDAAKKVFKLSRQALKRGANLLPTWDQFKTVLLERVNEYNASPHRGLPRFQDQQGISRHYSPDEYWNSFLGQGFEPVAVPEHLKEELFMPAEHRKVLRGAITFLSGKYAHKDLEELHGEVVEIRYDIWDSAVIHVFSLDGVKICTAEHDSHASPYFGQSVMHIGHEKRRKAQLARLEQKVRRIEPGASIALPDTNFSDHLAVGRQPRVIDVQPVSPALPERGRPLFLSRDHHYRWLMEHRDLCTDADEQWLEHFSQSPDYADMADRYVFDGIGYERRERQEICHG